MDRPDVDETLIDALIAMTPDERLHQNDRTLAMLEELRNGIARATEPSRDPGRKQG